MDWGRIGAGIATGGLSEAYRALDSGALDRQNNEYAAVDRADYDSPGYAQRDQLYNQQLADALRNNQAQAYTAQDSAFRGNQSQLAQMLMGQARGENSLSAEQLRQGQMSSVAQQQALAASAAPGQQSTALRMAMGNAARQGYGMSGQAAMAGIAERNAAAQSLGGVLSGARGQDQQMGMYNAGNQQAASQFNAGQNGALAQALLQAQLQNAQAQQQGSMAYQGDRTQRFGAMLGVPTTGERVLGAAQGAASMAAMASDERAKESIEHGGNEADEFMRAITPQTWEYKAEHRDRPEAGHGRFLGVMAQDLERTKAGKAAVTDTPKGKVVDFGRLGSILTASVARLNERLDAIAGEE